MGIGARVLVLLIALAGQALAQSGGAPAALAPPPPVPPPWWWTGLSILSTGMIVAGAVAMIGALRGRWVVKSSKAGTRRPSRTTGIAGVVLGLGALLHALLPRWPPPAHDVITDRVFSSGRMPAMDLELPPGWRLTHGVADGVPDVLTVTSTDADAGARTSLVIQSSRIDETVDVARLAGELATGMESSAAKVAPPAPADVAGMPAMIVNADRADGATVTIWVVKRDTRLVSYLYCFAPPATRNACAPIVARVRWHTPGR